MAPLPSSAVVGVVGAGTMGSGIAQVAAAAGHAVLLFDSQTGAIDRGIAAIRASLARIVERKRMTDAAAEALLARIRPAPSLEALKLASLVVEAIVEDMPAKKALFAALEGIVSTDAILATNTSALSITEMAGAIRHPERVVGLHFFNPAPIMPLVEVISGFATAPDVANAAFETALAWGKTPVRVKSTPGFLGNRVARPYYGEALRALEEGVADVPTYDAIMREAAGFRMGPFELLDLVGIDVNWAVTNAVHDAYFHDPRYKPFRIQGEMVAAGRLGRKTKRGFYDHRDGAAKPVPATAEPGPRPAYVIIEGDLGPARALESRIERAGLALRRVPGAGFIAVEGVRLALSDGRMATERFASDAGAPEILFDLALDYANATRIAIARADQAAPAAGAAAAGLFQALGMAVSIVDDAPGLVALRTVAMLANFGADAVHAGIAHAAGVDRAMQVGFNYPKGPLAWADHLGLPFVLAVLDHIARAYGEDRYRASPLMRRRAASGGRFHA